MRTLVVGRRRWLLQTGSGVGADPEDHSCSSVLSARGSESARLILYDYKSFPLPFGSEGNYPRSALAYSHSIVAGGLLITSRKTASILPFLKLIISSAIS